MGPLVKLICLALAAILHCTYCRELQLEVRQARSLVPGSTRGFHDAVTLHEQDSLGAWTARYHEVRLYGGIVAVGEYYARVKLGGQTVRVQIDTGSATLAVPMQECTNCKKGDMRYDMAKSDSGQARLIDCSDPECESNRCSPYVCGKCSSKQACCAYSDDTKCAFHLSFGDGSGAKGVLVSDVLQWGDVKFPVIFGGIRSDSPDFERNQVDGIMGMAYPRLGCNPSCVKPTFESARDHLKLKDMFSICMTDTGGKITLGAYDPRIATTNISWVPMRLTHPKTFYNMKLLGNLQIGSRELELPSYNRAIVDSGTTLIVFSKRAFRRVVEHLQTYYCRIPKLCNAHTWFRPAHCVRIQDEDRLKLPTLVFRLENFDITLDANEYMINYKSKGPDYWCVGLMELDTMSGGVDIIFGNTVMKKYLTIYDRVNERIGFAESGGNCEPKRKSNISSLPVKKPDLQHKLPRRHPTQLNKKKNKHTPVPPVAQSNVAKCVVAKTCDDCAKLGAENCFWDIPLGACVPGTPTKLMCAISKVVGNLGYVIAGVVITLVILIALIAVVVCIIKKRRSLAEDARVDALELEESLQPLASSPQ